MKNIILTLTFVVITACIYGQTINADEAKKKYKNVFGIDATGLLKQFLNFSNSYYYASPYMIIYKRTFKSNALRVGIRGSLYNASGTTNDTLGASSTRNSINIGLGFEHYQYLSKRWALYFGADVLMGYSYSESQYDYSANTSTQRTTITYNYGASPLLGLLFKLNSRLSISSETSYDILHTQTTFDDVDTPSSMYDRHSKSKSLASQFNAPTSIIFRIEF